MKVGNICRREVATVTARAPLSEAASLLCAGRADAVVAIATPADNPTAIGIITARDILRAMLDRVDSLNALTVVEVLSRDQLVLNQDDELEDALRRLQGRDIAYAPVVGTGGTLLGAISMHELLLHRDAANR